jgi:transcriptional regulator with XRE-family HTH domain
MDKALNLAKISSAMVQAGFSPAKIAKQLDVSREAVSKWLSGKTLPRPDKLLRLALALDLKLDELVIMAEDPGEPVIAFRKRGNSKTTEEHIARAKDMGRMLSELVPYLPYDLLVQPATLKNPTTDYAYIQQVAAKIRAEIGVAPDDEITFNHLIKKFNDLQAVIVPVLWGKKDKHENALHIYLPDSMTTWVYLNLDVEVHDFKFWMAHELGHVHTPELRGTQAEDFADALAGALIFPETLAAMAYDAVTRARTDKSRVVKIRDIADRYSISLISVYYEINKYAKYRGLETVDLDNGALFGANTNFNKQHLTVSQILFDTDTPDPQSYIETAGELFASPVFDVLKRYLLEHNKSAGYVQSILNTPLLDAKGIHAELT